MKRESVPSLQALGQNLPETDLLLSYSYTFKHLKLWEEVSLLELSHQNFRHSYTETP